MTALAHDFRIISTNPKIKSCFSEINIGLAMPPSYSVLVKSTLTPATGHYLSLGPAISSKEAHKLGVFTDVFDDHASAEKQIASFADTFSKQGTHREAMKVLKTRMFQEYIDCVERNVFAPIDISQTMGRYKL